jgi:hypothetical protein
MSIVVLGILIIATIAILAMRALRPHEVEAAEYPNANDAQATADLLARNGIAARTSTRSDPGVSTKPRHVVLVSADDVDDAHALLDGRSAHEEPEEASIHAAQHDDDELRESA